MYGQYASKNQINLQPLDLDEMITDSVSSKQTPFRSKLKRLKNSTEWLRARDQSSSSSSIGDETSKTLAFTPIDQNETMPPLPIIETCRKRKRRPSVYSLQRLGEEEFPISRSGSFETTSGFSPGVRGGRGVQRPRIACLVHASESRGEELSGSSLRHRRRRRSILRTLLWSLQVHRFVRFGLIVFKFLIRTGCLLWNQFRFRD